MRVPLPGRDYFPPRVLLRGARSGHPWSGNRPGLEGLRAGPVASSMGLSPAWDEALPRRVALPLIPGMRPAIA